MTMMPMMKKCPKCKKLYSYNPDVGQFNCPYCGGIGNKKEHPLREIFKKNIKK